MAKPSKRFSFSMDDSKKKMLEQVLWALMYVLLFISAPFYTMIFFILLMELIAFFRRNREAKKSVHAMGWVPWKSEDHFKVDLLSNRITSVEIFDFEHRMVVTEHDGLIYQTRYVGKEIFEEVLKQNSIKVRFVSKKEDEEKQWFTNSIKNFLKSLIPFLVLTILVQIFSKFAGKAEIETITQTRSDVPEQFYVPIQCKQNRLSLDDIAGYAEEKKEFLELLYWVKNQKKLKTFGIKVPKGVLMLGPSGTGKTRFAKALAGSSQLPIFALSASEFVDTFVGEGALRIRALFEAAKKNAPCIIFIDEIDILGARRGMSSQEYDQTLNQFLCELDGYEDQEGILVLGATNLPDKLDPAMRRPGRFDREMTLGLPSQRDREEILQYYLNYIVYDKNLPIQEISRRTSGFSGAALATLVNEAALWATQQGHSVVGLDAFEVSKERILSEGYLKVSSRFTSYTSKEKMASRIAARALIACVLPKHPLFVKASLEKGEESFNKMRFDASEYSNLSHDFDAWQAICVGYEASFYQYCPKTKIYKSIFTPMHETTQLKLIKLILKGIRCYGFGSGVGKSFRQIECFRSISDPYIEEELVKRKKQFSREALALLTKYHRAHQSLCQKLLLGEVLDRETVLRAISENKRDSWE